MKQIAQVQEFQESFNQVVNREPSLVKQRISRTLYESNRKRKT
jgi:hypothetical protein